MEQTIKQARLEEVKRKSVFSTFPVEIQREILDYANIHDLQSIALAIPELLVLIREKRREWSEAYGNAKKDIMNWAFGHLMDFLYKNKLCNYKAFSLSVKPFITYGGGYMQPLGSVVLDFQMRDEIRKKCFGSKKTESNQNGDFRVVRPEGSGFADVFSVLYSLYGDIIMQFDLKTGSENVILRGRIWDMADEGRTDTILMANRVMRDLVYDERPHGITEPKILRLFAKYKDLPILGVGGLGKIKAQFL